METSQYLSEVLKELQLVPQLISDTESEQPDPLHRRCE